MVYIGDQQRPVRPECIGLFCNRPRVPGAICFPRLLSLYQKSNLQSRAVLIWCTSLRLCPVCRYMAWVNLDSFNAASWCFLIKRLPFVSFSLQPGGSNCFVQCLLLHQGVCVRTHVCVCVYLCIYVCVPLYQICTCAPVGVYTPLHGHIYASDYSFCNFRPGGNV